jgi:hypothetical protein
MATHTNTYLETPDTRSLGEIFRDLVQDIGRIIRDEVQLARAEFAEKTRCAKTAGGAFAAAALSGLLAAASIVAGCIAALALVLPVWLAALVMGILLGAIAGGAYIAGSRRLKSVELAPRQTLETLKEDVEWVKHRAH